MERHILLVDADHRASEVESLLSNEGYRVVWERSGQAALASAQRHPPDLVITELQLPDLYWTEFFERLQDQTEAERLAVFVMTTSAKVAEVHLGPCNISADCVFHKPFGIDRFIKRVREATDVTSAA